MVGVQQDVPSEVDIPSEESEVDIPSERVGLEVGGME